MKNAINYYYKMDISNIRNINDSYYFVCNNNKYVLKTVDGFNILNQDTLQLNNFLINQIPQISQIQINYLGSLITSLENNNYILLRLNTINDDYIRVEDIININKIINIPNDFFNKLDTSKWDIMWTNKIDYFELFINENRIKYMNYLSVYNYYIGLSELAIATYRDAISKWNEKDYLVVSHKRIKYKDTIIELLDPTNIVIDYQTRDFAEYCKEQIIHDHWDKEYVYEYFKRVRLTKKEAQLFIARLLFPSYFFDLFENYINSKIDTKNYDFFINSFLKKEDNLFTLVKYISDMFELNLYNKIKSN